MNYEKKDVSFSGVMMTLALLTAFIAAGFLLSYVSLAGLEFLERKFQKPLPPMMQTGVLPPEPRLQAYPAQDLMVFQKEQQKSVSEYEWVNQAAGVARIPVERAMQILAKEKPAENKNE